MQYKIYSIKDIPEYRDMAIDWFASKWGIDRIEYEKSFEDCLNKNEALPQWYLLLDEKMGILGGCGLIENDFIDRTDLFPYLCALFVEPYARGHALGAVLLEHVRREGAGLGFGKIYLCTDHTSYYERYGWRFIGNGNHPWGSSSRIYKADSISEGKLEPMASFFSTRVNNYDEHMLNDVEGCSEGYRKMAQLIPQSCKTLLDLGCGTGLELDEIFKVMPDIRVTGIDLTQAMLNKLKQKHPEKSMKLICGSYFDVDFGEGQYDCAVSFQTMHHFSHEAKIEIYKKIYHSLNENGIYIECDYMVDNLKEEELYYKEYARLRLKQNLSGDALYHYDTPCTIENQIKMLRMAGFIKIETVFRKENTTMLLAVK